MDTSDGGQIAPANTPSPPGPDTGTAGSAATPSLILADNNGASGSNQFSYWSPATVQASTTYDPSNPGGGTGGGTGGGSTGTGTECGTEQNPCKTEITGDFESPVLDESAAPSFADALTTFRNDMQSAPIAQSLTGLANYIPTGGAPPSETFTLDALGGHTFTLTPPQPIIDRIAPVLRIVMLMFWALTALMLFFKA